MSYFVYILRSTADKKLYVGCTKKLETRLREHAVGQVESTKFRRPLELVYSEQFLDKGGAFQRERFLKSLWGAREKKKILKNFLTTK